MLWNRWLNRKCLLYRKKEKNTVQNTRQNYNITNSISVTYKYCYQLAAVPSKWLVSLTLYRWKAHFCNEEMHLLNETSVKIIFIWCSISSKSNTLETGNCCDNINTLICHYLPATTRDKETFLLYFLEILKHSFQNF